MKKLLLLVLGLLIVIVGFFAFSVFYSKNKVDLFFTANDGVLYKDNLRGIRWELGNSTSKIFNGKYTTKVLLFDEQIAVLEHEAKFGLKNFNIFKMGSIKTEIKFDKPTLSSRLLYYYPYQDIDSQNTNRLSEIERLISSLNDISFSSDIRLSGIDTKIDIKEGSKELEKDGELLAFSWKDIDGNYLLSFKRDTIEFNANIPYISSTLNGSKDNNSLIVENQIYKNYASKRKTGIWLGNSLIKIGKISFASISAKNIYDYDEYEYDDYDEYYSDSDDYSNESDEYYSEPLKENDENKTTEADNDEEVIAADIYNGEEEVEIVHTNFTLLNIDITSSIKEGSDSTLYSDNKISVKNFALNNEQELVIDNAVLDISLQNIDLESVKKMVDSLENVDFEDKIQLALFGASLVGYLPNTLAKHPKIILNELSAKYANQTHKANGFIQYIGDGNLQSIYQNIKNDIIAKLNMDIGLKSFNKIYGSVYYNEEEELNSNLEKLKEFGFKVEDDKIKGDAEYKNNSLIVNGKETLRNIF
ncbi:MAG: YdgA family protein [Campylobacteraceae bacterium]|jgi:hypothetical protein|nr:YdgA family protein [Campylobacteraceae bacterium]